MNLLETPRLRLRPWADSDLHDLVRLIGDWAVSRWLDEPPWPYTYDDGRAWIARNQARQRDHPPDAWAIARRRDDRLLGAISLHDWRGENELGYWLGRPFWRQGLMSEAVAALLPLAFAERDLPAIVSRALPDNAGSCGVLHKAGFRVVGEVALGQPARTGGASFLLHSLTRQAWSASTSDGSA
ncbi:MAG: GNAT family N-acetyltransferase [Alphaproteobacteria bacterium]